MANIKKTDSINRLQNLQQELNQLLAEFVESGQGRFVSRARHLETPLDVFETDDALHFHIELPGVEKEDIGLYLSRDLLTIEGTKKAPGKCEGSRFLNVEREFGTFKRDIGLPKPTDAREIIAKLEDGILYVRLPKISDRRGKRRKIDVE